MYFGFEIITRRTDEFLSNLFNVANSCYVATYGRFAPLTVRPLDVSSPSKYVSK